MHESVRDSFREAFRGSFYGVLRWPQLDELWATLRRDAAGDWYIYAIGEEPPGRPVSAERLDAFINEQKTGVLYER